MGTQRSSLIMSMGMPTSTNPLFNASYNRFLLSGTLSNTPPHSKGFNVEVDCLSKKCIMEYLDGLHIEIKMDETWLETEIMPLPG